MAEAGIVLYTAAAEVAGGRGGRARSASGRLDVALSRPGASRAEGTDPEELFAAGYAACFDSAVAVAATRLGVATGPTTTSSEVDLVQESDGRYALRVRLVVSAPEGEPEDVARVVELADQLCPYSRAVRGNVPVELTVAPAVS